MKGTSMGTRIALLVLTALLALPLAQTASPVEAKRRPRTVTRTFSNTAPIKISTDADAPFVSAEPYPATIAVSGMKGTIRDVNVRLNNYSHTYSRDVEVLLVGPSGRYTLVMVDVGPDGPVNDVTLRLDDEAARPLPSQTGLQSGAFRPTYANDNPLNFNAPAPPVTNLDAALSVFDDANPNGTWRLFVQDNFGKTGSGMFAGGWELEITTKATGKKKR